MKLTKNYMTFGNEDKMETELRNEDKMVCPHEGPWEFDNGSTFKLTGFAGGGLPVEHFLL